MLGVAISTHNRYDMFKANYGIWLDNMPDGAILIVVDDCSDTPVKEATFRFNDNVGVARTKNKCLELLYEAGVDDFFLVDDDCYPILKDWYKPYIQHKEPHLMAIFTGFGNQTASIKEIYRDYKTVAYNGVRGYFLYYKRIVLDTVGGFDTDFGRYWGEHTDLTNRIHNAGLTTYRSMDVPNSERLIYSMDSNQEVVSTITGDEYIKLSNRNRIFKREKSNSKEYKEFRQ